jgi:hypothetical protein
MHGNREMEEPSMSHFAHFRAKRENNVARSINDTLVNHIHSSNEMACYTIVYYLGNVHHLSPSLNT